MENVQRMCFCPEGENMGFAYYLLKDRAQDWCEDVNRVIELVTATFMTWEDFVQRFKREFSLAIEVQQLLREFQDLRQTIESVAEIIAKFRERAWSRSMLWMRKTR